MSKETDDLVAKFEAKLVLAYDLLKISDEFFITAAGLAGLGLFPDFARICAAGQRAEESRNAKS